MRMNSYLGKEILSIIRDGNYAHPGEEEAIELTFQDIPKNSHRQMLDVGCGRGGTAHYLNINGWGNVTGIDIDPQSIQFATQQYQSFTFIECNVLDLSKSLNHQFDLFYLFNAFYTFDNQAAALESLRQNASPQASLLIFDYVDLGNYAEDSTTKETAPFLPHPINYKQIPQDLNQAGWDLFGIKDISKDYERWCSQFMDKVEIKREEIITVGGDEAFDTVRRLYGGLLDAIQKSTLGGVIVDARIRA